MSSISLTRGAALAALSMGVLLTGCYYAVPGPPPVVRRDVYVHEPAPAPPPDYEPAPAPPPDYEPAPAPPAESDYEPAPPPPPPDTVVESETVYIDEVHPGVIHQYYYYPDVEVYYDPITLDWCWMDGGVWRSGRRLPPHIHVHGHRHYAIRTDARHPYDVHARIRERVREHHHEDYDHRRHEDYDHRREMPSARNDYRREDYRHAAPAPRGDTRPSPMAPRGDTRPSPVVPQRGEYRPMVPERRSVTPRRTVPQAVATPRAGATPYPQRY